MKIKNSLTFMNTFINKKWKKLHSYQRKEVEKSIAYTNLMAKKHYDKKHKSIRFNVDDKVYLNLHQGYKLGKNDSYCKLEVQCTGPHKVLKWISNLVYQLKLPETMQIYNVISVMQFKSHSEADSYEKESQLNFNSVEEWEGE